MSQTGPIFDKRVLFTFMKIQKQIIFFALAAISVIGCNKKPVISNKQEVYFQYEYVNHAMGDQHTGFLIDHEGKVLTYENPQNWNFPDSHFHLTDTQIRENVSNCKVSGKTILPTELEKYTNFIKNISLSKVTALKNVATDAGTIDYICYMYSPDSSIYKGYIIKKEGDFTCENLNFYSKKVSGWLKNINDSITVR